MAADCHRHERELQKLRDRLAEERDRRYAEVNIEREKALKIKETADLAALQLAREIQTYKDEKANELREQINRERGLYATKDDMANLTAKIEAITAPLVAYVNSQTGRASGNDKIYAYGIAVASIVAAVVIAMVK